MARSQKRLIGSVMLRWLFLLGMGLGLTGCAAQAVIEREETADTVLLMGLELTGFTPGTLGYYFVLHFEQADGERRQSIVRPRSNDQYIVITDLPPAEYQLVGWAARSAPGVTGFNDHSLRIQPLDIRFALPEGEVSLLSQQMRLDHREGDYGLTQMRVSFVPLDERRRDALESRAAEVGPEWTVNLSPIGDVPEASTDVPKERGVLDFLLGS